MLIEGWAALLIVVIALASYRHLLTRHEDDTVHLSEQAGVVVRQQASLDKRVSQLDVVANALTILLVLYAFFIAGQFVYQGWIDSNKIH
jgi:hypothetical protein